MDWNIEYGDLSQDQEFVESFEDLKESLIDIQNILDELLPLKTHYDKMCVPAQIELDLFLAFTLNSLHWVRLRVMGIDPNTHPIKGELERVKAVMNKWREVKEKEKRVTIDIEAAKRFIKSGLYDPYRGYIKTAQQNTKIKFKEDDE